MTRSLPLTLCCALIVIAIGGGIKGVEPAHPHAPSGIAASTEEAGMTRLPTVEVVATRPADDVPTLAESSVMFGAALERAGENVADSVGAGVRRVSLAVPYYAFGGVTGRSSSSE